MRVIGRNHDGRIVGYFETSSASPETFWVQRLDAGLRLVEQFCLTGFRESVAFLCATGADRFECIPAEA